MAAEIPWSTQLGPDSVGIVGLNAQLKNTSEIGYLSWREDHTTVVELNGIIRRN
jgi:hypothetical protein